MEGGGGGGAGGKKPVIVAMSFALLSWNSLEGLKQHFFFFFSSYSCLSFSSCSCFLFPLFLVFFSFFMPSFFFL